MSKKLTELRVVDLKVQLEKRGLEKSGNKALLVERLLKELEKEGVDLETFLFEDSDFSKEEEEQNDSQVDEEAEEPEEPEEAETEAMATEEELLAPLGDEEEAEVNAPEKVEEAAESHTAEMSSGEELRRVDAPTEDGTQASGEESVVATVAPSAEENASLVVHVEEDMVNSLDSDILGEGSSFKALAEDKSAKQAAGNKPASVEEKEEASKEAKGKLPANSNLWISGLSSTTRATDLKSLFSKYGKVNQAKVVTSARRPGAKCYGYLTMSTAEEAQQCIQHLHRTDVHGRTISVERAKGDPSQQSKQNRSNIKQAAAKTTESNATHTPKPETPKEEKVTADKSPEKSPSKTEKKDAFVKTEPLSKESTTKESGGEEKKQSKSKERSRPEGKKMTDEERLRRREQTIRRYELQNTREASRIRRKEEFVERRMQAENRRMQEERVLLRTNREQLEREREELERGRRELLRLEREMRERELQTREHMERARQYELQHRTLLERATQHLEQQQRAAKRSYESSDSWTAKRSALDSSNGRDSYSSREVTKSSRDSGYAGNYSSAARGSSATSRFTSSQPASRAYSPVREQTRHAKRDEWKSETRRAASPHRARYSRVESSKSSVTGGSAWSGAASGDNWKGSAHYRDSKGSSAYTSGASGHSSTASSGGRFESYKSFTGSGRGRRY